MQKATLALIALAACAPPRAPSPSERPAPVPLTARFPLPAKLPARYLRTIEHDPGGYDDASPPGGPSRGGASDLLLGDLLFHTPSTLGPRARALGISCQSCHPNGATNASFAVAGLDAHAGNVDVTTDFFRPGSSDGVANEMNIPSLRGARFTGPYGHDGRTASLAEFTFGVVTTEFGGAPLAARELAALVRYVQDLDFLPNASLDARSKLTVRASAAAHRGEAIFARASPAMDGRSCATCHDPSTFFRDGRVHRLGTGTPASPHAIEDGVETPTLLGTAETAPYFHDGRFRTLGEVVAWFDASYALALSPAESEELTAYLEAVGAVDRSFDDRPLARKLGQAFAYVALAGDPDGEVRKAALDEATVALSGAPPAVATRVAAMRAELAALRARAAMASIDAKELRALRGELTRLGADWAGALAP